MEESEKTGVLRAKRRKSIDEVLEEVDVLIETLLRRVLGDKTLAVSEEGYREPELN